MRIIPAPKDVIGESLLLLWRRTPELQARFPESEEGVAAFCSFVHDSVRQKVATAERI